MEAEPSQLEVQSQTLVKCLNSAFLSMKMVQLHFQKPSMKSVNSNWKVISFDFIEKQAACLKKFTCVCITFSFLKFKPEHSPGQASPADQTCMFFGAVGDNDLRKLTTV